MFDVPSKKKKKKRVIDDKGRPLAYINYTKRHDMHTVNYIFTKQEEKRTSSGPISVAIGAP